MATTPVFLPEKPHRKRSLAGYSLWGPKESDMTEQLNTAQVGIGEKKKRGVAGMLLSDYLKQVEPCRWDDIKVAFWGSSLICSHRSCP